MPLVFLAVVVQLLCRSIIEDLPQDNFGVVPWYPMLSVDFVGVCHDPLRSGFDFCSVDDDG